MKRKCPKCGNELVSPHHHDHPITCWVGFHQCSVQRRDEHLHFYCSCDYEWCEGMEEKKFIDDLKKRTAGFDPKERAKFVIDEYFGNGEDAKMPVLVGSIAFQITEAIAEAQAATVERCAALIESEFVKRTPGFVMFEWLVEKIRSLCPDPGYVERERLKARLNGIHCALDAAIGLPSPYDAIWKEIADLEGRLQETQP